MQNTSSQKIDDSNKGEVWSVPHRLLLRRLESGWQDSSADVARDFVSRWSTRLKCSVEIRKVGDSSLSFLADLSSIRFAGMHEANCLLVSGSLPSAREAVQSFWKQANSPGRAILLIAANPTAESAIKELLPKGRYAILSPGTAVTLLETSASADYLKTVIRAQVGTRRLIPFDTEHPIDGHMFCGRAKMLNRLVEEEDVNFAVAGPGRIGKTSLLRRFLRTTLKSGDQSRSSQFYIDLMPCVEHTADGLARYIALRVDSSSKVSHLTCDRLEAFLTFQKSHHDRPIQLLLDETDEFLALDTFQFLGNAARKGLCRLILAGRGNLLQTILHKDSRLYNRIQLLRLDPLTEPEAEALLIEPLEDLGFSISQRDQVLSQVAGLTGLLPQYVQFYGRRICQLLIDGEADTVNPALISRIRDEYETLMLFSGPIFEVKKVRSRFAAFALLGTASRPLSIPQIQGILHNQGLIVTLDEVWDIANELVIQNVLAWNRGRFQIANESLPYYMHTHEFLSSAMRELRLQLGLNKPLEKN